MSDLVERLRNTPCDREPFTPAHADCRCRIANEAADEIERLRMVEQQYELARALLLEVEAVLVGVIKRSLSRKHGQPVTVTEPGTKPA